MMTLLETARSVQALQQQLNSMSALGLDDLSPDDRKAFEMLTANYMVKRAELSQLPIKTAVDGLVLLHQARQAQQALVNGSETLEPLYICMLANELRLIIDNLAGFLEAQSGQSIDGLCLDDENQTVN